MTKSDDSSGTPKADPRLERAAARRAERPSGQEPRTRDLRAEGASSHSAYEPAPPIASHLVTY